MSSTALFALLVPLLTQPEEPASEATPTEARPEAEIQRPAALREAPAADDAASRAPVAPVAVAAPEPPPEPQPPEPQPQPQPVEATPAADSERFTVSAGAGGPPYYDAEDEAALRARHGIEGSTSDVARTEGPRWRCLIADPACGRTFEVNALAAYTYRGRQSSVTGEGQDPRWSSGRAQYDLWVNFPVMSEVVGRQKFTRMTLGPKGGLVFSDGGSTWGNLGLAMRYWLGRGRWAPSVEFSSALVFMLGQQDPRPPFGEDPKWQMTRGPVGFTADVGFGIGGFGAIVVGGQYDSPLAREDITEQFRTPAGGAFFLGFRGNILWGGPAAAAVATHAITQRTVETP